MAGAHELCAPAFCVCRMSKPIIGLTRDSDGSPKSTDDRFVFYSQSVERAGGTPRSIFFRDCLEDVEKELDQVDGILLIGGDDLDPALYGQTWHPKAQPLDPRRQRWELALIAAADRRRMPTLGICLGCQVMNVHRGGSLHQFLPDLPRENPLEHRKVDGVLRRHDVTIDANSRLAREIGKTQVNVNTYHKQAIDRVGRGLVVTARATDGVVEAIEDPSMPLFVGVQWHPERISDEPEHLAIFRMLVEATAR